MGTIESILSFCKTRLRLTSTDEDLGLLDLANETIRTFNCFETYVAKRKPLERESRGGFCLPKDFYHEIILEAVGNPFIGASDPANINPLQCVPLLYYDSAYLKDAGWNGNLPNQTASWKINGNTAYINGGGCTIVSAILTYQAYNVDEQGRFHAPVDFELAVAERIMTEYMHDHRKNYASDTIAYHSHRADTLFSQVRSKSVIRDFRRNYAATLDVATSILMDKNPDRGNYGGNGNGGY